MHKIWRVTCYYVQNPDVLVRERPDIVRRAGMELARAQAGKLAIQVDCHNEGVRDLEVQIANGRPDIGLVEVWEKTDA